MIHEILSRLDHVRRSGNGKWSARCPAHDDRDPSLAIEDTGDRILLHCFAGCDTGDICSAVGLDVRDLFHGAKSAAPPRKSSSPLCCAPEPNPKQGYAVSLWERADTADRAVSEHPYAIKKGIGWAAGAGRVRASGRLLGREADCLAIPIRSIATDTVQGVQAINPEGAKQTFGQVSGGALILGNSLSRTLPWFIVEGWADAVSLVFHVYNGNAVAVAAFGLGMLAKTGDQIKKRHTPRSLAIVEDAA